jgi:uncharacterized protein (TIGR03437 family)
MLPVFRLWCGAFLALVILALTGSARADLNSHLLGQSSPFPGEARYADVWGEGNFAYVGSGSGSGVMIFDISDTRAPFLAGFYNPPTGGQFQDVVVINGIGYFSSENNGGVHIVNVRDPARPTLLSQIGPAQQGYGYVHELFVGDGVLYEADGRTPTVKVFDVRNPAAPVFIRNLQTTDSHFIDNITMVNGRLYTSGWGGTTGIYDVQKILTEPPVLLGSVNSGSNSHSSWVSNDGKLLACARETSNGDVRLFDISNPANPVLVSDILSQSYGINGYSAHNGYIVGNLLFVSWYQAGTQVFDITRPAQPVLVGSFDTNSESPSGGFDGNWGVYPFLGLDRVLLSDSDEGLFIVDFTDAVVGPRSVSAASYSISAIADSSLVAMFGSGLATTIVGATLPLTTSLGGTTVRVLDAAGVERLAPILFVSPSQVNYQVPRGTSPGPATVTVTNSDGTISSGTTIVSVMAPSLFSIDGSGRGAAAAFDAITFKGAPFSATRPNGEPSVIAFYATGLGADATDVDGNVSSSVQVTIDSTSAVVAYAGQAPGFPGLNQLNVVLPAGLAPGIHTVRMTRGGRTSATVTIEIG